MAVGAGDACAVGVNRFPPVGLMLLSVGAGEGATEVGDCVVAVVVGDRVVDGAFEPLLLQLAIDATNAARSAAASTKRASRTAFEFSIMTSPIDWALITDSLQRPARERFTVRLI
jgi:hypothetical protein